MVKAMKGQVILQRLKEEEKVGSLFIPEVAQKKPQFGKIVSVGEGHLDVKVGDVVFFESAINKFLHDGEWYHAVKMKDIAGVVENET